MRYMIFFTDNQYYDTEDRPVETFDDYLYELRRYGGGMTPDFFTGADTLVEAVEIFKKEMDYDRPMALVDENENWKVLETYNPDTDKKPVKTIVKKSQVVRELIDDELKSLNAVNDTELEYRYRKLRASGFVGYNNMSNFDLVDMYVDVFYMGEYDVEEVKLVDDVNDDVDSDELPF